MAHITGFLLLLLLSCPLQSKEMTMKSIREFGVLPTNDPLTNKTNLQKAIDWASRRGAALWVEPDEQGYPMAGGLVLRQNAGLIGVHGPVGRGTRHPQQQRPVGSVFVIEDEESAFITVESATQIRGIQFWYPKQTVSDSSRIIPYPATIRVAQNSSAQGVTLSCLTFYGEYLAMDFNAAPSFPCEQILFEHCYGYPLSGQFIRIDRCYDIPRILHCHVNPANRRLIEGGYSVQVIDAVVRRGSYCYAIDHTDNAQLMDLFTFGVHGGVRLGAASYGQLTNFNFDCVTVGIYKDGDQDFNRNWQISQGSIIANTGARLLDVHPIVITGKGHTSLVNVECFSGANPALTTLKQSQDYLYVLGTEKLTVSLFGCRMRNYAADHPFTVSNERAVIQAVACIDRLGNPFNYPAP